MSRYIGPNRDADELVAGYQCGKEVKAFSYGGGHVASFGGSDDEYVASLNNLLKTYGGQLFVLSSFRINSDIISERKTLTGRDFLMIDEVDILGGLNKSELEVILESLLNSVGVNDSFYAAIIHRAAINSMKTSGTIDFVSLSAEIQEIATALNAVSPTGEDLVAAINSAETAISCFNELLARREHFPTIDSVDVFGSPDSLVSVALLQARMHMKSETRVTVWLDARNKLARMGDQYAAIKQIVAAIIDEGRCRKVRLWIMLDSFDQVSKTVLDRVGYLVDAVVYRNLLRKQDSWHPLLDLKFSQPCSAFLAKLLRLIGIVGVKPLITHEGLQRLPAGSFILLDHRYDEGSDDMRFRVLNGRA